jgi:hypothetical protein
METTHNVVDSYLLELRETLQPDRSASRQEFFENIAEHIALARSELDPHDETALREALTRLGDPRELATNFLDDEELDAVDTVAINSKWGRRVPPCVLALVLVFTASGALWWRHYQTLAAPGIVAPSLVLTASGAHAATDPNDALGFGNNPTWQEPAGHYSIDVVVGLWNDGSFPISIDHISAPIGHLPGAGRTRISLSPDFYFGGGPAFHPFTLGAGTTIYYSIRMPESCIAERGGTSSIISASAVEVETSFLGYHRIISMPISPVVLQLRTNCH